jgi:hypothetical protein
LRVDVLPDPRQLAISNGDVKDPIVLERLIRAFDFPRSDADDQNPVSLRRTRDKRGRSLRRLTAGDNDR